MMADEIRQAVRTHLLEDVLAGEDPSNLTDDMPLRTSGIIDSMGVIRLTGFLEQRFGIRVEAHETGVENTDTVDAIVSFVESKAD
ncbi:MAG: acyl carrier protein [Phycisphaerae bacterium]|nr:acyl carrier protein [Phycisphaerae bacterium]